MTAARDRRRGRRGHQLAREGRDERLQEGLDRTQGAIQMTARRLDTPIRVRGFPPPPKRDQPPKVKRKRYYRVKTTWGTVLWEYK